MGDELPDLQEHYDEYRGDADGLTRQETFDILCFRNKFPTAFDVLKLWKDKGMEDDSLLDFESFKEFHDSLGDGMIRLQDALDVFDVNGDGEFDREEFKAMLKAIDNSTYDVYADTGDEWDQFVEQTFKEGDTDGNGKISREELTALLTSMQIKVTDDGVEQNEDNIVQD